MRREQLARMDPSLAAPFFAEPSRLDEARGLTVHRGGKSGLSLASYRRDRPKLGLTTENPREPMFMAVVTLQPLPGHEGWRGGRHVKIRDMASGTLSCLDLRESWVSNLPHPFHTAHLFIPQLSFDELTDELRLPRIEQLDCPNTRALRDPFMMHLVQAALPLLDRPEEVDALLADHLFAAIRLHLASSYGGLKLTERPPSSGLAPWQIRRTKEMMLGNLALDIDIAMLAAACDLSPRQFTRAFRGSMHASPHAWRQGERIDAARHYLAETNLAIAEIALCCGFADQSHLTRVFTRLIGSSPAAYRRIRRA